MLNQPKNRVKLNRFDVWRTVLTDTVPFEVPIVFSNDGFYKNLSQYDTRSPELKKLIDVLVFSHRSSTIPLRYAIVNEAESVRNLSLIHPYGQVCLARFYEKYDQLICEYGRRSSFSIRQPDKIGRSFASSSNGVDEQGSKSASIDATEIDFIARNPQSYFSYYRFNRLYHFFSSDDYIRLERKFKYQLTLDISKCFDSIYTHSITWAVKTKQFAKENIRARSFGDQFDRVMRSLNDNETSGICIGPEASRIFAEIILARVDQIVYARFKQSTSTRVSDFDCRRYVDNYYVFANSDEMLRKVRDEIADALLEFKLYLNESKTDKLERPFYSRKSIVIDKVNASLQKLWERIIQERVCCDGRVILPRRIYRRRSLFANFTREVKSACYASGMGYDAVSKYIISAISRQITELAETYAQASRIKNSSFVPMQYRQVLLFLLDVGFHYFTLHPTFTSSLRLSRAIVRTGQHLAKHDLEGFEIAREAILRWANQFARSPGVFFLNERSRIIPIELLNILVSLREFTDDGSIAAELLDASRLKYGDGNYFKVIVQLYIFRDDPKLSDRRDRVFQLACDRVFGAKSLTVNSELTHLLLDLLACPFIDVQKRAKLLMGVWPILKQTNSNIGAIGKTTACKIVNEIEQEHWFVRWKGIGILDLIEKKDLGTVYA